MALFKIIKKDNKTHARVGVLSTPHGKVETPSYVFVGTYGQIRYLSPSDIKKTKTQLIIANTFHLWDRAKNSKNGIRKEIIKKMGKVPLMTDSGGFQVLSLAFGLDNKVGKFIGDDAKKTKKYKRQNVRITEKGVFFYDRGGATGGPPPRGSNLSTVEVGSDRTPSWKFLGPKLSMQLQSKIGADIIFAFDHITGPLDNRAYNNEALKLTDKWAKECLKVVKSDKSKVNGQFLYGIVQGGVFKDLRIKSAKSIGSMPFDGFGIGGSYTKKQIAKILDWVIPHLPADRPRHLLGVGKVGDVFEAVEKGVDTFDCVIPTREARHGRMYTTKGIFDIRMGRFADDKKVVEPGCKCPTCSKNISRSKIRSLLKSTGLKHKATGQRYTLMHNMWFFNNLLENIRLSIKRGRYTQFRNSFLKKFNS